MMLLKSFFRRIIKDFRHKELLPLKLIFFVQASTLYVLYPYLTIHMRELGISVEETAIMSAITPFVAMVMPPLAGMFADRIGNFKILLSLFSSFGGLAALLLLLVPLGRVTVQFPDRVVMDLGCNGNSGLIYTMSQNHPCDVQLQSEVAARIESCGYTCRMDIQSEAEIESILFSNSYTVRRFNLETGANDSFKYNIARNEMTLLQSMNQKEDMREHRKLHNNEYYRTSIRPLSKEEYFFPTNHLHEFTCTVSGFIEDFETSTLDEKNSNRIYENRTLCTFNQLATPQVNTSQFPKYHAYKSKLTYLDPTSEDLLVERRRFASDKIAWIGNEYQKINCGNGDSQAEKVILTLPMFDNISSTEPYKYLSSENCSKRCIVTAPRDEMCSNMSTVIEYNVRVTFWLYLAIRVFIGIIGGTTFAMFEGAVIAILREQKADYGLQRIYGSIGGMISSPLSGLLIDYASTGKGYTDFRPAFYLYAGLKLISGILMLAINLEFKSPASNVVRDVFTVLRNIEAAALFIACFILGTAWGYIESFLFWLIQDLGGSGSLMGITITVGGIAGIPLLVLSGPIINKIGHANVLFIGFIFYAIRLCGYSLIYNPWHTLIFEALESVTLSLSFTAAVTYAARLSTTTTDSSIQGLLGGVYYGVGKGTGSLIGGYLMKAFGTRPTYRIFAVVTLITGIIYYIFNVAYLKKRPQVEGNDIVKKKPKKVPNQNGLENGVTEIGLEEKKRSSSDEKEKEKNQVGIDNQGFTEENENGTLSKEKENSLPRSIEAINNAKNLDKLEIRTPPESRKKMDAKRIKKIENVPDLSKDDSLKNGVANPTFENDNRTDVNVEKPEDDKK